MDRRTTLLTGLSALGAAVALSNTAEAEDKKVELAKIHSVLKAHDDAMTGHNLAGVMATFAPKAVVMGTGPGEVWATPDQIKEAYKHFFEGFDKGQQDFTYHERHGSLGAEMGYLFTSGEIKGKKGGKAFAFPINLSITVTKVGADWKIAAMHFSNLVGEGAQ